MEGWEEVSAVSAITIIETCPCGARFERRVEGDGGDRVYDFDAVGIFESEMYRALKEWRELHRSCLVAVRVGMPVLEARGDDEVNP